MINKLNGNLELNCSIFNSYDYNDLSLNELLCTFFTKINECIDISNRSLTFIEWLVNIGLSQEVSKILNEWLEDGTLAQIINEDIFKELNQKIQLLSDKIDNDINLIRTENENFKNEINNKINNLDTGVGCLYVFKNTEGSYGDCSLVTTNNNKSIMIDCMESDQWNNLNEQLEKVKLKKLDYLLITHFHSDHIGCAKQVIEKYKPTYLVLKKVNFSLLDPVEIKWKTEEYYNIMVESAKANGVEIINANDQTFQLGDNNTIQLFASNFFPYTDPNYNAFSLNFLITVDGVKALFPGDSTKATEEYLKGQIGEIDILKLSHHGADGGNTVTWFKELKARYGIINRTNIYKNYTVETNALNFKLFGGQIYSNDNNNFVYFGLKKGGVLIGCERTPYPNKFVKDLNNNWILFNSSGYLAHEGIHSYKVDHYYTNSEGVVSIDTWVEFQGESFYCGSSGSFLKNEFIQRKEGDGTLAPNKYLYVGDDGRWVDGGSYINYKGNTYVLYSQDDPDKGVKRGEMAYNGFVNYNGVWYWASENGVILKNEWAQDNGNWYYFNTDGHMLFNKENVFIDGDRWNFDSSGVATKVGM